MTTDFTSAQRRVLAHDRGHAVVIAVAGAGKTTVMTERVVRLVRSGVSSSRIAMLTFTVKAAESMKQRIARQIPDNSVTVGTFHAFCFRWLKICDPTFSAKEIILPDHLAWQRDVWAAAASEAANVPLLPEVVLRVVDRCRSLGLYAPEALDKADENDANTRDALRLYAEYFRLLRESGYYEVGDLVPLLLNNLQNNETTRRTIQNSYDHVIVDEYQDTDAGQEEILEIICGCPLNLYGRGATASLMVVGDPNQSIYSFRNASPKFIEGFSDKWGATTFVMADNFRSTQPIIDAANKLLRVDDGVGFPEIIATRGSGAGVRVYAFIDESRSVSKAVEALKKTQKIATWSDAAIIYRTNGQAALIESALTDLDIPYVIRDSSEGFFGLTDVKALVSYLRLAMYEDVAALRYVLNRPTRMLKKDIIDAAARTAKTIPEILSGAYDKARGSGQRRALAGLSDLIIGLRKLRESGASTVDIIQSTITATQYGVYLERRMQEIQSKNYDPLDYIARLCDVAKKRPDPESFLTHVTRVINNAKTRKTAKDGVNLLTIHGAKGLEFEAVFLIGCVSDLMPHSRAVSLADQKEERRLMYVAVTRAKTFLCISTEWSKPSPYIAAMGLDIADPAARPGGAEAYGAQTNDRTTTAQLRPDGEIEFGETPGRKLRIATT